MKKLLAILLVLVMVFSLAACQDNTPTNPTEEPTPTNPGLTDPPTDPTKAPVEGEALPANPLYHWDFETTDGLKAIAQDKVGTTIKGLKDTEHAILTADGVVGKSLYLDGKYGIKLPLDEMNIADDSYTISFWIYAERIGDFMPIVQLGHNLQGTDTTIGTAWMNFTRGSWAETYPLVWNRNTDIAWDTDANGVFPWIAGPEGEVKGKNEWCLITLVVDGNRYTCLDDNGERIGTRYYLNGELVFDASAELMFYQGVAPEILTGATIEGFIGINYWDSLYKGYIDELYIYDEALTSGQVKTLFDQGDTSVEPVAPEYEWKEEEVVITLPTITADSNAIGTVGTPNRNNGFFTQNTKSYALAEGQSLTMKLNNYTNAEAVWNNFCLGFANVEITAELVAGAAAYPGYAEYCIARPDGGAWGAGYVSGEFTKSWETEEAFIELMKDAEATVVISRSGDTLTLDYTLVGADGTTMTATATIKTTLTADAPCHVFVSGEKSYVELLSVA